MFKELQNVAKHFEINKEVIATTWVERENVHERLLKNGIDPHFFANHFGVRVIEYAVGVIQGTKTLGDCPVIHVMLDLFQEKKIPLNDLFIICAGLKTTFILIAYDSGLLTEEFISKMTDLMDQNFEGVMIEYMAKTQGV